MVLGHFDPEVLGFAQVLHPLPLEDHAGIGIGKYQLFRQGKSNLAIFYIAIGDLQQHIGIVVVVIGE